VKTRGAKRKLMSEGELLAQHVICQVRINAHIASSKKCTQISFKMHRNFIQFHKVMHRNFIQFHKTLHNLVQILISDTYLKIKLPSVSGKGK
jgi:hypothetical protein